MDLRDYQLDAEDALREAVRAGHRRIIVQMPTGAGKTVFAGHIQMAVAGRGKRALFAAHRLELLEQPYKKLVDAGVDESLLSIRGGGERKRRRADAPLQICSIGSLKRGDFRGYDVIFIDEAHRAACKSYLDALEDVDPNTIIIGLTATPERLDGKGLDTAGFTVIIVAAQPSLLIERGYIVDPDVYTAPDHLLPDLSNVTIGEDFAKKSTAVAVDRVELIGGIVEHYAKLGQGLPAISFAVNVPHSKNIVAMFEGVGIRAVHVDGGSRREIRSGALKDLREGRVRVVSQCDLWVEGLDEPELRVCIDGQPTASLTRHLQKAGRVMRPNRGLPSIILDHAGNTMRHGLPSEDRTYSLKGRPKGVPRIPSLRRCNKCYLIVKLSATKCHGCGQSLGPEQVVQITYTPQQLAKIDPESFKHAYWNKLWLEAYEMGDNAHGVRRKYEKRFNAPPQGWDPPRRPPVDRSPQAMAKKREILWMIAKRNELPDQWVRDRLERIYGTNAA